MTSRDDGRPAQVVLDADHPVGPQFTHPGRRGVGVEGLAQALDRSIRPTAYGDASRPE
ncbi:hypothetical protein [Nocardia brevicatena]|uniref:hypothetical protein n=1 Tax=Nocardia brevicatena TaxID=37327 RepID=UPI0012FA9BAA|nr:hypothetical protein [Nocardia brevicatena]